MSIRETAAVLASALPTANIRAFDDHGKPVSVDIIAAVQADQLAEMGWALVRADEEATP